MEIKIKRLSLAEIKLNPDNPRQISEKHLDKLVKSLREFPEMRQIREIVVDENMVILGGNMRFRALQKIGEKTAEVKIVTGLTDAQKREFIIKDNAGFGDWDFDILANGWDDLPLDDWGMDLPVDWLKDPIMEQVPNLMGNEEIDYKTVTLKFPYDGSVELHGQYISFRGQLNILVSKYPGVIYEKDS